MSNPQNIIINDRYELHERIGRGGMADVFMARDLLLDRDVAVKILFPEHAVDPNFVERFRREAQSVAGLNHPNIVGVYDWGQTGNTYFMAMEFVKGRTLAEVLRRQGRLTARSAASVGGSIANALAYAHRNNVVHRDIKPANILMASNGDIKVVDFGIARALDSAHDGGLTQDGAVMGTATYFSPEQAKGDGLDLRSDLYSLGIVLYELVTGKPPFSGESALATAYKQVHATAEQLRDDLRYFLNNQPTMAMDEVRIANGLAPRGSFDFDQATSVMAPISQDPETTQALPHTQVMPTTMTPVETLPDYDEEPGNKRNYIVGAAVAGLVILGGLIFLITSLGGGNSGFTVPNVKGATCDVAKQQLEALKFSVAFSPAETVCDATAIVASQDPASGDTATEGEIITLVFPAATVEVPPLLGLTEEAARAAIEGAGFVFAKGPDVIDKTYALGQVAVQNPAGRLQLAKGMTVTVNLSGGTGQLAVPNVVVGQTTASAQTFLQGEPYKFVVTVAEEASATIAKGIVIRTDPVAGTLVNAGVPVTVYVSSGPQPVATPSVKGLAEADARAKLTAVGLGAEVEYVNLAAGDVNIGKVISQGTPAGTMIAPPTKVVLTVGRDGTIPAG